MLDSHPDQPRSVAAQPISFVPKSTTSCQNSWSSFKSRNAEVIIMSSLIDNGQSECTQFEDLNLHMKSATTIAQILWYSGVITPGRNEDLADTATDFVVATLTNLAHCLVRIPIEVVATGLLADSSTVVAANSAFEGSTSLLEGDRIEQDSLEELSYAAYATNSPNASAPGTPPNQKAPPSPNACENAPTLPFNTHDTPNDDIMDLDNIICEAHHYFWKIKGYVSSPKKTIDVLKHNRVAQDYLYTRYDPPFPSHARNVFRLFGEYLHTAKEPPLQAGRESPERIAVKNFNVYVLGMSLVKLKRRLKDPAWRGRTVRSQNMPEFLQHSCRCLRVKESIPIPKDTNKGILLKLAGLLKVEVSPEARKDLNNGVFTTNVANIIHEILKGLFIAITEYLIELWACSRPIQKPDIEIKKYNPTKFEEIERSRVESQRTFGDVLLDLHEVMILLYGCVQEADGLLKLYVHAIELTREGSLESKIGDSPLDDPPLDDPPLDDPPLDDPSLDQDPIEDETWHEAYLTWIKSIVRQIRASSILTSLKAARKKQFSMINIDIIEERAPSQKMEPWRTTIKRVFDQKEDLATLRDVLKYLDKIAGNELHGNDKSFKPMQSPVLWRFRGAIHCESIIASRELDEVAETKRVSCRKITPLDLLIIDSFNHNLAFPVAVALCAPFCWKRPSLIAAARILLCLQSILANRIRFGLGHYRDAVRSMWQTKFLAGLMPC